jgi:hypothetical protein
MIRRLICVLCGFGLLASSPNPALAVVVTERINAGLPVRVTIISVAGEDSAATIFELGHDKVRDVISLTAPAGESATGEITTSKSTRRIVVLVDVVPGAATRVRITQGLPPFTTVVLPDETTLDDKRYVLDVVQ